MLEARAPASAEAVDPASRDIEGARHVWPTALHDVAPGRYIVAAELWREGDRTPIARRETAIAVSGQ